MKEYIIPVAYEVKTRNGLISRCLDVMYDIYGINDFSLSTQTSSASSQFAIYPDNEKAKNNVFEVCTLKSVDELLLAQYLRIGSMNSDNDI